MTELTTKPPAKKPFLYVVACACGIAGDVGKLITAAQERNRAVGDGMRALRRASTSPCSWTQVDDAFTEETDAEPEPEDDDAPRPGHISPPPRETNVPWPPDGPSPAPKRARPEDPARNQ
ncbi:hypothetical protein GCM10011578_064690 [Streptomyces fuscichromogenes]|uniref:Uncharacterized protein n=1 Tax=Streptomyces fuscichromogenes TaxID=1324013 RepID=A0A917XIA6_9ACTN|nr:hypothetical protein GCM10011578_064690 [Streptomyces fuscichromogenes]